MAEFTYYLRDYKAQAETPIILFIRYEKITLKYSTGEKVLISEWNQLEQKKRQIAGTGFVQFNIRLAKLKNGAEEVFQTYQNANNQKLPNLNELRELLNIKFERNVKVADRPKEHDLFSFIEDFIKDSKYRKNKRNKPISINTIEQYQLAFNKLVEYRKYKKFNKFSFENVNPAFYKDYEKFLESNSINHLNKKPKTLSQNTIANNFKMLKVFFNDAHEKGYLPNFISRKLEVKKVETFSIYLNEQEIEQLNDFDLSHDKKLDKVKDLFVVGCWTGLRFSDLSRITSSHIKDGFIKIITYKTDTPVTIPLHPIVNKIIEKYKGEMPKAISNQKMNDYLKVIGELAGLNITVHKKIVVANMKAEKAFKKYNLITTHTARRSFASNMYLMGFEVKTIMAITGHSTEQSFMGYIKLSKDEHAHMIKKLWEQKGIFKQA